MENPPSERGTKGTQVDLVSQFKEVVEATTGTVELIPPTAVALAEALKKRCSGRKTVFGEPETVGIDLFQPFIDQNAPLRNPSAEDMATADVGISDAFAGVARTGSICTYITKHTYTAVSLLAEEHVVVLEAGKIVPRPRDVFASSAFADDERARNIIFISGPSSTADMGSVVRGAHGPRKLHVILLESVSN